MAKQVLRLLTIIFSTIASTLLGIQLLRTNIGNIADVFMFIFSVSLLLITIKLVNREGKNAK